MPYLMSLFGKPIRIAIPSEFTNEAELLAYLKINTKELKKIWYFRNQMYRNFLISKENGKVRAINAPDLRLKFLQRKLAQKLDEIYQPRNPVHGFVAGKSVKTNALAHLARSYVVNIDLSDFFPTITQNRIEGMLSSLGIDERVAEIIAQICCHDQHLPQGAPSSPVLSNMICFRLDKKLMDIAKNTRCIYTRYADDITFSSHQPPTALFTSTLPPPGNFSPNLFSPSLLSIFSENGFTINPNKTHYADRHSRRIVTGVKINEVLNVDRRYVRNIRAAIHSVESIGIKNAEIKFREQYGGGTSLSAYLRGKISFLTHIKGQSDPIVRSIIHRFNNNFPSHRIKLAPTPIEIRDRAVWVLDNDTSQGTAFFLNGIGLVTAAHCVTGAKEFEIFHPSKPANKFKATVRKQDEHRDLAILDHSIPPTEYYQIESAAHDILIGDPVTAVGYPGWGPGDRLPNVRPGFVSTLTVKSLVQLIEVTQKLSQGMSGGPLLDTDARVVGIIHKGGPEEGRDFAIHINVLKNWA